MDGLATTRETSRSYRLRCSYGTAGLLAVTLSIPAVPAFADNPPVPWECSNYGDEARTRCLNAFIEQQRDQISRLEGQLRAQQEAVGQLKGQLDRQAAAAADVQQQLSQRQTAAIVPAPYAYSFVYPPVGFGIYLGRPWIYGPPYYGYYGRPFWGPRYYGHWKRRW